MEAWYSIFGFVYCSPYMENELRRHIPLLGTPMKTGTEKGGISGLWPFRTDFWVSLDPDYSTDLTEGESLFVNSYSISLIWARGHYCSINHLSNYSNWDKTRWVSSQLRISLLLRRLLCFQQWGFQRFPASLLDRARHPLSGNPLVFNLKFPFASSFLCQLPLQSALSKSFTIYIFQVIRRN